MGMRAAAHKREGFTMMEVLIVVAIIAATTSAVALMLPTQYDHFNRTIWENELKALTQAVESYYLVHGSYPQFSGGNSPSDLEEYISTPSGNRFARFQSSKWTDAIGEYADIRVTVDGAFLDANGAPPQSLSTFHGWDVEGSGGNIYLEGNFCPRTTEGLDGSDFDSARLEGRTEDDYRQWLFDPAHRTNN